MLQHNISIFLDACKHYNYSKSTIGAFTTRLNEFDVFIQSHHVQSIKAITYQHLMDFMISRNASHHVKKIRVWTLRQFFHFLKLNNLVDMNVALKLPYPKLEITEPEFLTLEELKTILDYFHQQTASVQGLRNLIIVMILSFLGIRLSSLRNLNIQDVILPDSLLRVRQKGYVSRSVPLPQIICIYLYKYLKTLDMNMGPLFLSKRKNRLSARALQYIFDIAENELDITKHLHCHLFRHTAATQINQTAGLYITKSLLGHRSSRSTERYIHLDGTLYANYMRCHFYHEIMEVCNA
ncbi:MAG TPA: integrase [Desulfobacterales bacterium]|nr:integrase [Desulfobacterales bacterium]